jgi:hypothetical protein
MPVNLSIITIRFYIIFDYQIASLYFSGIPGHAVNAPAIFLNPSMQKPGICPEDQDRSNRNKK